MITQVYAYEIPPKAYQASIFLVDLTTDVLKILSEFATSHQIELVVFIPEPRNGIYSNNYFEQVEWEKRYLDMADAILAWIPSNFNSSLKFGKYVDSGKLFYGRPDDTDQVGYLDWMYIKATGRQVSNSLRTLAKQVVNYLQVELDKCLVIRKDGEKTVPLSIWQTKQFQNWYQSQLKVGNKLISAELLWHFVIHKVNFVFAYALQVKIWVAAENRIKSNEFIISRPDISVVVAYWRHPSKPLESEVILIKEFRSPARTADGFVHELPSGSSFKAGEAVQLASDELFEETGIKIKSDRFQYVASKQLAATWSTHFADVYAIELKKEEIDMAKQMAALGKSYGVAADTEKTYIAVCQVKEVGKYVDWAMEGMIYRVILNSPE
jgi:hypothetical protein